MQVSASSLGGRYGLTGAEMNHLLAKLGYLKGEPGAYSLTDKGELFAQEEDHHRGCGGYSFYNRYWTTRTFDDSIQDELEITPELVHQIREEVKANRLARRVKRDAEIAEYERVETAKQMAREAEEKAREAAKRRQQESDEKLVKYMGIGFLVAIGVAGVSYGIYKLAPRIKRWWEKKTNKQNPEAGKIQQEETE